MTSTYRVILIMCTSQDNHTKAPPFVFVFVLRHLPFVIYHLPLGQPCEIACTYVCSQRCLCLYSAAQRRQNKKEALPKCAHLHRVTAGEPCTACVHHDDAEECATRQTAVWCSFDAAPALIMHTCSRQ